MHHFVDCALQLLESQRMPILNLESRLGLRVFHLDSVEEVADSEEADALADEAEHFHLRQVSADRQVLES